MTGEADRRARSAPEIAVIISSYNGADSIGDTVRLLESQTLPRSGFEVVVVDDGSTDGTADAARRGGADRVVRVEPNAGLAVARNTGVGATTADIVAFTDDDCQPDPGWLSALLDALRDPHVDGVSGKVVPTDAEGFISGYLTAHNPLQPLPASLLVSSGLGYRLMLYLRNIAGTESAPDFSAGLYSVVGANMAFRRAFLEELGGFDPAFRFGGEEEDVCRRGHDRPAGARLAYCPAAVIRHPFEGTLSDVLRRARAYGVGNARMAAKHRGVHLIVFPVPAIATALVVAALVRRQWSLLGLALAVPALAYLRWIRMAARRHYPAALIYAYVQAAQETATMVGEVIGARRGYAPVENQHRIDQVTVAP